MISNAVDHSPVFGNTQRAAGLSPPCPMRRCIFAILFFAASIAGIYAPCASTEPAHEIAVTGPIGPATVRHINHALPAAANADAPAVILRLDTPGGLARSMRQIVKTVLASQVPIICYVAPSGARAASAGTYILYACDIAAMAPATNVGAATPVTLGPGGVPTTPGSTQNDPSNPNNSNPKDSAGKANQNAPADSQTAERRKIVNNAVAYIRSLAETNDRNADWTENAVRAGASISAQTARSKGVIDLIAPNTNELLNRLDGRQLQIHGNSVTLHTSGLSVTKTHPGWRTQLIGFITQPSVALVFFVIGIIGLIGELFAPGTAVPATIGTLSLFIGLYGFHMLPVNYVGLGLAALGVALMIAEAFVPSFGALGLGGTAAFVFGCVMLMNTSAAAFQVPIALIVVIALAAASILTLTAILFRRARRARIHTATGGLIGSECVAIGTFEREGRVWLHGESWRARTQTPLKQDARAQVVAVSGLTVEVEPMPQSNSTHLEG